MRTCVVLLSFLFLSPVLLTHAAPHNRGQSYVYFKIYESSIDVRLEITVEQLNQALGLSMTNGTGVKRNVVNAQIDANLDAILGYLDEHFYLGIPGGAVLALAYQQYELLRVPRTGDFVQVTYHVMDLSAVPQALEVEYTAMFELDEQHRNLVHVEHNWKSSTFNNEANVAFILSPSESRKTLDLSSSTVLSGFIGMIHFGIEHILIGFDHILFLVALILPSVLYRDEKKWKPVSRFRRALINIVMIVTFFTIAHTITLSLAALKIVVLPSILVESVIAASIAVAALHNLYPRFIKHEWPIAFVFGLFHGFGFASLLEPLGLGREYTVLTLLGFNAGVEVGQVIVIAAIFPVLFLLRTRSWYKRAILQVGSVVLIAVALFWFVERAFSPPLLVEAKNAIKDVIRPVYYALVGFLS